MSQELGLWGPLRGPGYLEPRTGRWECPHLLAVVIEATAHRQDRVRSSWVWTLGKVTGRRRSRFRSVTQS